MRLREIAFPQFQLIKALLIAITYTTQLSSLKPCSVFGVSLRLNY